MTISIRVKCTAFVPSEAIPRGMSCLGTNGGSDDKIALSSVGGALATLYIWDQRPINPALWPHLLFVPVCVHDSYCGREPPIHRGQHEHPDACPEDRPICVGDPRSKKDAIAWSEMKVHFHGSTLHPAHPVHPVHPIHPSMVVLGEHQ